MIDPGPDVEDHVRALVTSVEHADRVSILLTHGHGDHAGAVPTLTRSIDVEVYGPAGVAGVTRPLADGDVVGTDASELATLHLPGHTADHLGFHWAARRALFVGDLMLGRGDTTWVAEYPGCVADYLASLERMKTLELAVIYPAHGPPLTDPPDAIARFEAHRRSRIAQVREAIDAHPDADLDVLLDAVYGDTLSDSVRRAARLSIGALVDYVRGSDG